MRSLTHIIVGVAFLSSLLFAVDRTIHVHALSTRAAQTSAATVQQAGLFGVVDGGVDWVNIINGIHPRVVGSNNLAPEDVHGWPTTDASYVPFDVRKNMPWDGPDPNGVNPDISGSYALSFTGQATISNDSQSPDATVISNQHYTTSTNTTTATVTILPHQWLVILDFTNTKRQPGDAAGDGITNVQLLCPGYPAPPTQPFTNGTIAAYSQGFGSIRTLGLDGADSASNADNFCGNTLTTQQWADRVLVSQAYQGGTPITTNNQICSDPSTPTGHQGWGIAWEYIVALANASHTNLWITIPVNATDDYVTKLAQLLKYGSDGVNPYTSPQAHPVWAPLNPTLNVYVEYSNEVWNFSYAQYTWNKVAATNEVNAGGSPLNNDGSTDQIVWAARRYAERLLQIGNLFKGVYGPSAITTTIRPVFCWQYDTEYASSAFGPGTDTVLAWFNHTFGAPKQFFYGIGEAPYYGPSDVSTVDAIFNTFYTNSDQERARFIAWQTLATYYGLQQIGYESGPGLATGTGALATRDPRITATEIHHFLENWYAVGGGLVNFEALRSGISSYGDWLLVEDFEHLNTPKMQGARDILTSPLPPITAGFVLPTQPGQTVTIDASQYAESSLAPGSGQSIAGSTVTYPHIPAYLLRAAYAGTYTFSLTGNQDSSDLQETLSVDNTTLGTLRLPTTPGTTASLSTSLSAGFHTVQILYTYGNGSGSDHAHPQTINVGLTSGGGATIVPSAPGNPQVSVVANGSLTIEWPTTTTATSYTVLRSTSSGGPYSPIATNLTKNTYVDTGLTNGTTYYYVVQANNSAGGSALSPQIPGTPTHPALAAVPTNLQATFAHNGVVQLSWTGNSDAIGYRVWRSTTSGSGYQLVSTVKTLGAAPLFGLPGEQAATTFTDGGQGPSGSNPNDGTTYFYVVTAVNSFGESASSSERSVTPTDAVPTVPTGLTATAGDGQVSLSWTPPPGMSPQFTPPQYTVYRSTTSGGPYTAVIQLSVDNAVDIGLSNGTTYYYVVKANNALGSSGSSTEVAVQPKGSANGWTTCADEYGTCTFSGTQVVRYGADGKYAYKVATGSIACTNEVFGNPDTGVVKTCSVSPQPPTGGWTKCADEYGICSFTGTATVAYGADGHYVYQTATGSIACTNEVFGNPDTGVVKTCYYQ